ncbi:putative diguanylate cyclase YdaM [Pigmentiphaga humi]|uniref:diguanylate cyclase n=1 Tax=Pigmentiphaga humi TaxID=2478468 RepID=A0A3P4B704_9BURK|nr:GGDEF domain-containing protein [Pigmentiphaga humi]VCU70955.1 putative diguanylate cyclase YdaM [Pigmentiphaga humi]
MPNSPSRNRWRVRGEITSRREVFQRTIVTTLLVIVAADLIDLCINLIYAPFQIVRSAIQTTLIASVLGSSVIYIMAMGNYKLYQMKSHLANLNRLDPHTGLLNRRAFIELAETALASARPHVLMLADVDAFKRINDIYGHPTGDHVIVTLARLMRSVFGPPCEVARMGGEEFSALLVPATLEEAVRLAEAFVRQVAVADFSMNGPPLHVSVSVGLIPIARGASFADIYARADQAMYRAKADGGNRVKVAS